MTKTPERPSQVPSLNNTKSQEIHSPKATPGIFLSGKHCGSGLQCRLFVKNLPSQLGVGDFSANSQIQFCKTPKLPSTTENVVH